MKQVITIEKGKEHLMFKYPCICAISKSDTVGAKVVFLWKDEKQALYAGDRIIEENGEWTYEIVEK